MFRSYCIKDYQHFRIDLKNEQGTVVRMVCPGEYTQCRYHDKQSTLFIFLYVKQNTFI